MIRGFLLAVCLPGCMAGTGGPGGTAGIRPWQVGISVTISAARGADTAIRQSIMSQQIDTPQRDEIMRALDAVDGCLGIASTSLAAYEADQSAPAQCRLHSDLDAALTVLLQVDQLIRAAGVQVPAIVDTVIGSVGATADAVAPACPHPGEPATARVVRVMAARQ